MLENRGIQKAASIADKVRQKIKDYRFIWDDRTFEVGVDYAQGFHLGLPQAIEDDKRK
jgi:hypothetical protein